MEVIQELGIGGGGAGAGGSSCCGAGGGYSGGGPDYTQSYDMSKLIINGEVAKISPTYIYGDLSYWGTNASSYYYGGQLPHNATVQSKYSHNVCIKSNQNSYIIGIGGLGGCGENLGHLAGNGGQAGSGGEIKVSNNAKIYAFNGNRYSDGTDYNNGKNEAPIYAQMGIVPERYKWIASNGIALELVSSQTTIPKTNYINNIMKSQNVTINSNVSFLTNVDMSKQGIGSGAGYIEVSNGTYTIDSSLN